MLAGACIIARARGVRHAHQSSCRPRRRAAGGGDAARPADGRQAAVGVLLRPVEPAVPPKIQVGSAHRHAGRRRGCMGPAQPWQAGCGRPAWGPAAPRQCQWQLARMVWPCATQSPARRPPISAEEINYQKAVKDQRLAMEVAAAKRERDFYLQQVDAAKAQAAMQERREKKVRAWLHAPAPFRGGLQEAEGGGGSWTARLAWARRGPGLPRPRRPPMGAKLARGSFRARCEGHGLVSEQRSDALARRRRPSSRQRRAAPTPAPRGPAPRSRAWLLRKGKCASSGSARPRPTPSARPGRRSSPGPCCRCWQDSGTALRLRARGTPEPEHMCMVSLFRTGDLSVSGPHLTPRHGQGKRWRRRWGTLFWVPGCRGAGVGGGGKAGPFRETRQPPAPWHSRGIRHEAGAKDGSSVKARHSCMMHAV